MMEEAHIHIKVVKMKHSGWKPLHDGRNSLSIASFDVHQDMKEASFHIKNVKMKLHDGSNSYP